MKIILSGGGTLGPVTPLLAMRAAIVERFPDAEFVWVGTADGPEKSLIEAAGLPYFAIGAGKWRRYFSFLNLIDIAKILFAFFQSAILIWQEKPDLLISAGGFVSVPLHWAGYFLGVRSWIHQQDIVPGLANRLMAPIADQITVSINDSVRHFARKKTTWIGNPARDLSGVSSRAGRQFFHFSEHSPVIFILGGGTGSTRLNQMVLEALTAWPKDWQIIHLYGRERPSDSLEHARSIYSNYHPYPFFTDEMKYAYASADVVVARAGFNTITELAAVGKPAILMPKEGHQEENARYFLKKEAALMLNEKTDGGLKLSQMVKDLALFPEHGRLLVKNLQSSLPIASPSSIRSIFSRLIAN